MGNSLKNRLGGVWKPLGDVFGAPGGVLELSCRRLEASWTVLEASWRRLGGVLGHLGWSWRRLEAL